MPAISVYLVGAENIFKEGVKSLLAKDDFDIRQTYERWDDLAAAKKDATPPRLILAVAEDDEDIARIAQKIKSLYAESRVVVFSATAKTEDVLSAATAGADGVIMKDISCEALAGSLKLVAAGKKIYPPRALTQCVPSDMAANANRAYNLSRQEMNIIHCLTNGEPNKIIARHLGITEATVKVHVRTILRKLGTSNRTQAAIFALSRGLALSPRILETPSRGCAARA